MIDPVEIRRKSLELREQFRVASSALFVDCVKELFVSHPDLERFSWVQYTPYFNDGDECVFSVRSDVIDVTLNVIDPSDGRPTERIDVWSRAPEETKATPRYQVAETVSGILNTIGDEMLRSMFGDHVEVVVHRDGTVEQKTCNHE